MNKDYLLGNSNNIAPSAVYVKKAAGEYVKIWDRTDDLKTPPIDVDYETVDVQGGDVKSLPPVVNTPTASASRTPGSYCSSASK